MPLICIQCVQRTHDKTLTLQCNRQQKEQSIMCTTAWSGSEK